MKPNDPLDPQSDAFFREAVNTRLGLEASSDLGKALEAIDLLNSIAGSMEETLQMIAIMNSRKKVKDTQ